MRPLDYRELVWTITQGPSPDAFVLAESAFDRTLETTRLEAPEPGSEIDLSSLLRAGDSRSRLWIRQRIPADVASDVGGRIWTALPPAARESLDAADLVRVKIATDVPAVADLPWECLHDGREFVALRPSVRFVRSVPVRFPTPPRTVASPLRVLLVVPNPSTEELLDRQAELDAVMNGLSRPEYGVEIVDRPSLVALRSYLERDPPPDILHFIGHGGLTHGEGSLILGDPDGRTRWLSATELAGLLPVSVRLVCLSTPFTTENYQIRGLCHLARAAGLVALPTVVTNQYPVGATGAGTFWTAFYDALVEHRGNVNDATHEARLATAGSVPDFADWASFSLVVRDQTGVSFDLGRSGPATERRRAIEIAASFASQLANDLAQQVTSLGDDVPAGLRQQSEVEYSRAEKLLGDLTE